MQETFMSDSEDEGGEDFEESALFGKPTHATHVYLPYYEGHLLQTREDTIMGDQSFRYLSADEMKSLGDDSLPIDVTKDERGHDISRDNIAPLTEEEEHLSPQHVHNVDAVFSSSFAPDNVDISRAPIHAGFLVSFMVDARGGAMRGCRHSGVRVIIPPRKAPMPMRITCRYLRKEKLIHPPPLMEGEACASRILEVGPAGAKFLGPVIIEVPHFASLRGKEREITILRSDNGETWKEHTLEASEEAVQDVLNESFDGEGDLSALEDLNTNRITRILTTDFPQYFALVTRIRQEVHAIGPEGGMVSSTVVPQVQAIFPEAALTKKIKVGLQAQPISPELVAKLLGNRVAVSPIVTVEPRRRKFHKPITLTIPVPQAATKGMINKYSGDAPTLRLLCSITGGTAKAQWEDVTGSTPLTFVNDCVSFTTTVSARFWLMDCRQVNEATKYATELYREAIHVPFMAKFVVFSKRPDPMEAELRVFCMTDDKEDKTLENQEHFTEVAKSRDVEVLESKLQYLEFAGNLVPVTKSGDQLSLSFLAFRENRLPFLIRVKDPHQEPLGRVAFMREPKVGRGEPPQTPICNLNIVLPDVCKADGTTVTTSELITLEKKYGFVEETGLAKPELIHKADLRLSDIARELGGDWVPLAQQLDIAEADVKSIKAENPDDPTQQALTMLRHWMQKAGPKATGNSLDKALRKINREDIINKCMFNVKLFTDEVERAVAKVHLDQSGFDAFKEELGPSRDASLRREISLDVSYDEQDMMKEAESAAETSSESGSLHGKEIPDRLEVKEKGKSPTVQTPGTVAEETAVTTEDDYITLPRLTVLPEADTPVKSDHPDTFDVKPDKTKSDETGEIKLLPGEDKPVQDASGSDQPLNLPEHPKQEKETKGKQDDAHVYEVVIRRTEVTEVVKDDKLAESEKNENSEISRGDEKLSENKQTDLEKEGPVTGSKAQAEETDIKPQAQETDGKPQAQETDGKPQAQETDGKPQAQGTDGKPQETVVKPEAQETDVKPEAKETDVKPEIQEAGGKPQAQETEIRCQTQETDIKLQTQETDQNSGQQNEKPLLDSTKMQNEKVVTPEEELVKSLVVNDRPEIPLEEPDSGKPSVTQILHEPVKSETQDIPPNVSENKKTEDPTVKADVGAVPILLNQTLTDGEKQIKSEESGSGKQSDSQVLPDLEKSKNAQNTSPEQKKMEGDSTKNTGPDSDQTKVAEKKEVPSKTQSKKDKKKKKDKKTPDKSPLPIPEKSPLPTPEKSPLPHKEPSPVEEKQSTPSSKRPVITEPSDVSGPQKPSSIQISELPTEGDQTSADTNKLQPVPIIEEAVSDDERRSPAMDSQVSEVKDETVVVPEKVDDSAKFEHLLDTLANFKVEEKHAESKSKSDQGNKNKKQLVEDFASLLEGQRAEGLSQEPTLRGRQQEDSGSVEKEQALQQIVNLLDQSSAPQESIVMEPLEAEGEEKTLKGLKTPPPSPAEREDKDQREVFRSSPPQEGTKVARVETREVMDDGSVRRVVTTVTKTSLMQDVGDPQLQVDFREQLTKQLESETWLSAEMDTSQVSVSSLPEDEKSEPTTATVSTDGAPVEGARVQTHSDETEWTETDESGGVKHVIQKTTHTTVKFQGDHPFGSQDGDEIQVRNDIYLEGDYGDGTFTNSVVTTHTTTHVYPEEEDHMASPQSSDDANEQDPLRRSMQDILDKFMSGEELNNEKK